MAYMYRITIGDWSGDGHDKTEQFYILSNKDVMALAAAWEKAKDACPQLDPQNMCNDVEDHRIPAEVEQWLVQEHTDFYNAWTEDDQGGEDCVIFSGPQGLAEYMLLFMQIGDPDLELKTLTVPWLSFATGGYGLFWV